MKRYYNDTTKEWYAEGQHLTRKTSAGVFAGIPSEELLLEWGFEEYREPEPTAEELLERAKAAKVAEIEAYDKSEAVNSFELAGRRMWYGKEDRAGLVRALDRADANGMTTFDMWYENAHYELPVARMRQMVDAVEDYAIQCLCVTEHHKADVMALTSVEDVQNYDHRTGYPQRLVFLPLPN